MTLSRLNKPAAAEGERHTVTSSVAIKVPGRTNRWIYQESGAESWIEVHADGSLTLGPLVAGDWDLFGAEGRAPKRAKTKKADAS